MRTGDRSIIISEKSGGDISVCCTDLEKKKLECNVDTLVYLASNSKKVV